MSGRTAQMKEAVGFGDAPSVCEFRVGFVVEEVEAMSFRRLATRDVDDGVWRPSGA